MQKATGPVRDFRGRIMFACRACGEPVTYDDLFDLGLREPEPHEAFDDYCDKELLDAVAHPACAPSSARAG